MNATRTERFVAKEQAGRWIVGDRYSMRVVSRHPGKVAAEYAARYYNREWARGQGR